jgi:hypothetical protein
MSLWAQRNDLADFDFATPSDAASGTCARGCGSRRRYVDENGLRSVRAFHNIGPELAQTVDAAGGRTPERRVTDEQISCEYAGTRLEQGIE